MKAGWRTERLGDVATLQRGFDLPSQDRVPGVHLLISSAGVSDTHHKWAVRGPGVVTGRSGSIGNVFFVAEDFWPLNTVLYVKDFHGNDPRFVFYLLQQLDLARFSSGTGVPTLNRNSVHDEVVSVPPLGEQERIVRILDEALAGIATAKANAEKNLENARSLFTSHLHYVYSQRDVAWEHKRVSEIAKHSLGKMLDKAKNRGDLQPYLRVLNVRWFKFDLSDLAEMPFLPEEEKKYTAIKGDVLICEGGSRRGRTAIWNEDYPIYFQKALHRVRFHDPVHSKWFVYYMFAKDQSGELNEHFTGTGIPHFTGETLADFTVPLPPKPQIMAAVAQFDALRSETQRLESIYQRKLAALEELKQSLLHKAFTGAL